MMCWCKFLMSCLCCSSLFLLQPFHEKPYEQPRSLSRVLREMKIEDWGTVPAYDIEDTVCAVLFGANQAERIADALLGSWTETIRTTFCVVAVLTLLLMTVITSRFWFIWIGAGMIYPIYFVLFVHIPTFKVFVRGSISSTLCFLGLRHRSRC